MKISEFIVTQDMTILEVMEHIDRNAERTAFVCKDRVLLAAVSDGDIRRYMLSKGSLEEPVSKMANYNPVYLPVEQQAAAAEWMQKHSVEVLPIVDSLKRIVDIRFRTKREPENQTKLGIPLVIMAGGKGTRLKPYTDILPKPLIPVGDKTISEHIIEHFEEYGCTPVYMIVNYKKNFIKSYFQEAEEKKDIQFIEEEQFLGTGGGLKLLGETVQSDFFMTNCDILIEADYGSMLEYHKKTQSIITMVCVKKKVVIPYGTVETTQEGYVKGIQEKPEYDFLTNTGMYIISPAFLEEIPENTMIDMTDVIQNCVNKGKKVGVYTVRENDWMDMGQLEELEKMRARLL